MWHNISHRTTQVFTLIRDKKKLTRSGPTLCLFSWYRYDNRSLVLPPFQRHVTFQEPSKVKRKSLGKREIKWFSQARVWSRCYGIKIKPCSVGFGKLLGMMTNHSNTQITKCVDTELVSWPVSAVEKQSILKVGRVCLCVLFVTEVLT